MLKEIQLILKRYLDADVVLAIVSYGVLAAIALFIIIKNFGSLV